MSFQYSRAYYEVSVHGVNASSIPLKSLMVYSQLIYENSEVGDSKIINIYIALSYGNIHMMFLFSWPAVRWRTVWSCNLWTPVFLYFSATPPTEWITQSRGVGYGWLQISASYWEADPVVTQAEGTDIVVILPKPQPLQQGSALTANRGLWFNINWIWVIGECAHLTRLKRSLAKCFGRNSL